MLSFLLQVQIINLLVLYPSNKKDLYHITAISDFDKFFRNKNERNAVKVCYNCLHNYTGKYKDKNFGSGNSDKKMQKILSGKKFWNLNIQKIFNDFDKI